MTLNSVDQHVIPASLRLACETNVTEILREAGPQVSTQSLSLRRPRLTFCFGYLGSTCQGHRSEE